MSTTPDPKSNWGRTSRPYGLEIHVEREFILKLLKESRTNLELAIGGFQKGRGVVLHIQRNYVRIVANFYAEDVFQGWQITREAFGQMLSCSTDRWAWETLKGSLAKEDFPPIATFTSRPQAHLWVGC